MTTIGEVAGPAVARGGLIVTLAHDFTNHPPLDVVIIPGGIVTGQLQRPTVSAWIARSAAQAHITASVCTGAFLLARAGLLNGRQVTTHWDDEVVPYMTNHKLPPIHPGEVLLEEFLEPMGISHYRLAKDIGVPPRRISEIVLGKRGISPDTALRLSRYFSLSERFWMNLQVRYDLEIEKDRLEDRLVEEVPVRASS